jgi:hypothetical protein
MLAKVTALAVALATVLAGCGSIGVTSTQTANPDHFDGHYYASGQYSPGEMAPEFSVLANGTKLAQLTLQISCTLPSAGGTSASASWSGTQTSPTTIDSAGHHFHLQLVMQPKPDAIAAHLGPGTAQFDGSLDGNEGAAGTEQAVVAQCPTSGVTNSWQATLTPPDFPL